MASALGEASQTRIEQIPRIELEEPEDAVSQRPSSYSEVAAYSSGGNATSMLDMHSLPATASVGGGGAGRRRHDRDRKIGHRRVDQLGQVTYKKKTTDELMAGVQLGVGQSVGALASKPRRDLLVQDFPIVESAFYPSEGSNLTPAHHYSDFRFKTYAPVAFRYFRELFGIQPDDFLLSMCNDPLNELSNPGASGSIFYITDDDEFVIKTVQHKEAEFLQKLLPGYYMNLNQNPRTLLPKFYGLFCYQCGGKNIRFIIMNNLLPTGVTLHEKYDLKGSTYKRRASRRERAKRSPTLKDLDFLENHPDGILLEADTYAALVNTIQRDCRVLQSFQIMDYSMLVGIHNLDQAARQRAEADAEGGAAGANADIDQNRSFGRGRSMKQRLAHYSTAMEAIHARTQPLEIDDDDIPLGGIPARNSRGERLFLFIGIIDILQSYRVSKKIEHAMKSMLQDGDTISVHRPGFYSQRFQNFFADSVFKKIPSSLKQSPSKKRSTLAVGGYQRTLSVESEGKTVDSLHAQPDTEIGERPDILPAHGTPPPTFGEATGFKIQSSVEAIGVYQRVHHAPLPVHADDRPIFSTHMAGAGGDSAFESPPAPTTTTTTHAYVSSSSPVLSGSTPTHTTDRDTEGTPSFTVSSPSYSASSPLDPSSPTFRSPPPGDRFLPVDAHQVKISLDNHNHRQQGASLSGGDVIALADASDTDEQVHQ